MTVSVILITAITAFYGHLWSVMDQGLFFHLPMISVSVLGLSALLCVRSNSVDIQRTVFLGDKMVKGSDIQDGVKDWLNASEYVFYKSLITEYVLCLKDAETAITKKSHTLTLCIKLFSGGCITFPLWVVLAISF